MNSCLVRMVVAGLIAVVFATRHRCANARKAPALQEAEATAEMLLTPY